MYRQTTKAEILGGDEWERDADRIVEIVEKMMFNTRARRKYVQISKS